ncbi:MAG: PH domain-containing protein, partial [Anaerolineae bacterium]|nr:PH domain-containing protein [Anaerolineae bacterium]
MPDKPMNESITFTPPQRNGIIFHISVMVALLAASLLFFNLATQTDLGPAFLAYLLAALFLAVPLPLLGYRLFSLCSAEYIVDRDGLHLRWGQRGEDIPIGDILWVRSGEELAQPLEQPTLRWPGSIVGRLAHEEAGTLEFMAAQIDEIVLIGVDQKVYVISPQDCAGFIQAYESLRELGSLAPFAAHSTYPNFVVSEVWESTPARSMLVVGFVLGLALWIWVGVTVPSR